MKYFLITLLFLVGVGFVITSGIIKHKVTEGRSQISQAQQSVDAVKRLSNLSEYTAPAGEILSQHAERKIHQGQEKADSYQTLSNWFMAIGIFLVVISALGFFFFWKNS